MISSTSNGTESNNSFHKTCKIECTRSWKSAIKNPVEVMDGFWVTDIEGEIPKEMHGTYFKYVVYTSHLPEKQSKEYAWWS